MSRSSRTTLRRLGIATATLLVAGVTLSLPAFAVDTTGTITGQYTKNGQPVTPGGVFVIADDTGNAAFSELDSEGRYTVADLQPGLYRVAFDVGFMRQYAFGKLSFSDADLIDVVAGQATTVNDEALPTGTLAGRLTQSDGTTPSGGEVVVHLSSDLSSEVARTSTDGDGRWRLDVPAADYAISFNFMVGDNPVTQWARQKVSPSGADIFTVNVGEEMIIDESLLPVGSISGTFTDPDGQAIVDGNVNLSDLAGNFVAHAGTDATGTYTFPALPAASYTIEFATPDFSRVQFARGQLTRETADAIVVTGGENTVVDEQLLAPGAIQVRARDADTGAVVRNICVLFGDPLPCDNGSGEVLVENVPPGSHFIGVESSDGRYFGANAEVMIAPGQTVEITVSMERAATIDTRVIDRVTGVGVDHVCVELVQPTNRLRLGNGQRFCSDASGTLHIGPIDPGTFRLFVDVFEGPYGRQWVGINGGTGRFDLARVVRAETGKVVTIPPIKMDRAGTVEGVVTGSAGQPLFALVQIGAQQPGIGGSIGVETDENGRYRFENLGPYDWPLFIFDGEHAPQWSGGVANRLLATGVRVREGQTTTFHVRLTTGTTVTGTVITADGTPVNDAFVIAHNVVTGDVMGSTFTQNGQYTIHLLPQVVRLQVLGGSDVFYNHWYVNAADFEHARTVLIPVSGTKTVNITVSRTSE